MVTSTVSATMLSFVGPNAFTLYTTDVSDGLLLVRSWWTRQTGFYPHLSKACVIPCPINLAKASTSTSKTATNIPASVRAFCRTWVFRAKALEVGLMDLL